MNEFQVALQETYERHQRVFAPLMNHADALQSIFDDLCRALRAGGKIVFMGNGGSAADAQHLAAELVVRYKRERGPYAALALTTDTSILTAHSNDYSFETVFERQVQALVRPDDLVIGLTTSGRSANVNLGLRAAREIGATTVAFTGGDGGTVRQIAQHVIIVDATETARIQEAHIFMGHWLCEALDLFGPNQEQSHG